MYEHLVQFYCGCISGWSQVIAMQPFEIMKVRLANQSLKNPIYNGIIDCMKKIYLHEGFLGFYKGSLSPLLGVGGQVAVQFGSNALVKKVLKKLNYDQDQQLNQQLQQEQIKLPINLVVLSGLITGVPSSFVVTPIDHTRIALQMQDQNNKLYSNSVRAGIEFYKKYGIKGLYLGYNVTLLRQVTSLGIYFGSYEYLVRLITQTFTIKDDLHLNLATFFFAGGFAGCLSWMFTYPIDYTKTIVQSDPIGNRQFKSAIHAAQIKYQQEGIRTFFKGMGVVILRSYPVNGVGFVSFQYCRKIFLDKSQQEEEAF